MEKALSLYAQKEAVISGEKRFTYDGFADRVFRLAHCLKESGIGKGDVVAVLHHNSHEFLESYYAVAYLGAILNPLNFRLSPKEMAFIINDSGAAVLISAKRFTDSAASIAGLTPRLRSFIWTGRGKHPDILNSFDYESALQRSVPEHLPPPPVSEDDLAHLYYTSGTTGVPKGVMLSHKNVCTHALAAIAELGLSDSDRWIHAAPLFHLADAWATFAITWVGGSHVMMPDFDPLVFLSTMQNEKVTITNMIPTMLNMLINTPEILSYDFSNFRAILSGGAPIAREVVRRIMDTFQCTYIQTYGMTEASPYLTLSILKAHLKQLPPEEQFGYMARTGRPFLAVLLRVVREDGTDVRADNQEVGEIIVKGDIVTKGYWNRPDETANAIREGWLHTGDMAVIDSEGYVNIVDRKKDMIITGGENVYSIEVENVLYTHPAVFEAAVIGLPDPKWGEAIAAFVVLKPGEIITEEEVIHYCRENIAHYKAPKRVVFIDALPKTGSGKIKKEGLRKC